MPVLSGESRGIRSLVQGEKDTKGGGEGLAVHRFILEDIRKCFIQGVQVSCFDCVSYGLIFKGDSGGNAPLTTKGLELHKEQVCGLGHRIII